MGRAWERVESIMNMAATAYPNDVDERDRRFGPLIEAGMRHLEWLEAHRP